MNKPRPMPQARNLTRRTTKHDSFTVSIPADIVEFIGWELMDKLTVELGADSKSVVIRLREKHA